MAETKKPRDRSETPDKVREEVEASVDDPQPLEFAALSNWDGAELRAKVTEYVDVTTTDRRDDEAVAINLGTLRAIVRAFVKAPNVGDPEAE